MSHIEVLNVLGTSGEQLSKSNTAGIVATMYKWSNVDRSTLSAIFQNGRLVSKAQAGSASPNAAYRQSQYWPEEERRVR